MAQSISSKYREYEILKQDVYYMPTRIECFNRTLDKLKNCPNKQNEYLNILRKIQEMEKTLDSYYKRIDELRKELIY